MNEAAVLASLKNLVVDNAGPLVTGLIHQGVQRVIEQVTVSNLTPPRGYYYILIYATEVGEQSRQDRSTLNHPPRSGVYQCQIEVSDEALVEFDDADGNAEAYEKMHQDFRLLCDRVADLIEQQVFIGTEPKLVLQKLPGQDRAVTKLNLSGVWSDTESDGVAVLYAQLRFTLYDGCVDTTGLY